MKQLAAMGLAGLAGLVLAACSAERDPDAGVGLTWQTDIAPAINAASCASCHAGDAPAGHYDLTSYLGALGDGADATANAIASDATSALIVKLDPATADTVHAGNGALHDLLRRWVVDDKLAYFASAVHPGGILDPASAEFHGKTVEAQAWNLTVCATCHDQTKPHPAPSCTTCHKDPGGPAACTTCHGQPPKTGAHATHVAAGFDCVECHVKPTRWDDEGHIRVGDQADPSPAEITFGARANLTIDPTKRSGPAAYVNGRCENVWCHGGALGAGGSNHAPTWEAGTGQAACGTCHGNPPPGHPPVADGKCELCHPRGSAHQDGVIEVGRSSGCGGCHGSAASPAPPTDLSGNTFTTALGVGAHQAHLQGIHGLRGPVACADCHLVPTTITSPGHLDTDGPAEVLPALGWDRTTATCSSAWCHKVTRPVWTSGTGANCGTCHGTPPVGNLHQPTMQLTDCATCHSHTMDPSGNIIITDGPNGPTSEHIDGTLDL